VAVGGTSIGTVVGGEGGSVDGSIGVIERTIVAVKAGTSVGGTGIAVAVASRPAA
jgi:hypothetical protein